MKKKRRLLGLLDRARSAAGMEGPLLRLLDRDLGGEPSAAAKKRRVLQLLDRELDGELSAVEREELERLVRLEPEARRSRAGWSRVAAAIAEDAAAAPELDVARMSARVFRERARGGPARGGLSLFSPRRLLFAASTAMVLAALLFGARRVEPPHHAPASAVAVARPPVDVFFGDDGSEDDRAAPVEIRF